MGVFWGWLDKLQGLYYFRWTFVNILLFVCLEIRFKYCFYLVTQNISVFLNLRLSFSFNQMQMFGDWECTWEKKKKKDKQMYDFMSQKKKSVQCFGLYEI